VRVTPLVPRRHSPHSWVGRPFGPPVAFVLHTESGGESGTVAEFANSSAAFSSHYVARLDGTLRCTVDTSDRTWSNGILEPGNRWQEVADACGIDSQLSPNHVTVTCETEDGGDPRDPVTDGQFDAVLRALCQACECYPSLRYLVRHSDISPLSRWDCPGDRWRGRFAMLARTAGLRTLDD